MTDLDHSTRYELMTSDQVPADELVEWLKEPGFAAYVAERQAIAEACRPKWTIYQIEIIFHHYLTEAPFPRCDARLYAPTVSDLIGIGILDADKKVTKKGRAFVDALLSTTPPKHMPATSERQLASAREAIEPLVDWLLAAPKATTLEPAPSAEAVIERCAQIVERDDRPAVARSSGYVPDWLRVCRDRAAEIRSLATIPAAEPVDWQPIETAPKGYPTDDAGCRTVSEWFLGKVSPKYRAGRPPFIVIRRSGWPHGDSWECAGEANYVPAFFDAWRPLVAPQPARETDDCDAEISRLREALKLFVDRVAANGEWDDGCFYYHGTSASELQEPLRAATAALRARCQP